MSLEEKLAALREAAGKRLPPEVQATMHAATASLRGSGILDRVARPGTRAPDFTLDDAAGMPVHLAALLARGPVAISVFRGFW